MWNTVLIACLICSSYMWWWPCNLLTDMLFLLSSHIPPFLPASPHFPLSPLSPLPTFPSHLGSPPYHTHWMPFSAKYIQYNIARQMATWSSIAFYLAFTINLLVALFYPFDQGSKSLGELLVALAYVIEHHSVSFPVMSPHCGLIDFCSCTQCRRQFVLWK